MSSRDDEYDYLFKGKSINVLQCIKIYSYNSTNLTSSDL